MKNLNKTNITLAYSLFLPKLNRSGFSLQDLINQTQDHEINKALVFGYVFNNLASIQSTDDLKSRLTSCLELVNEYRAKELLPYNDVVRLGNSIVVKLGNHQTTQDKIQHPQIQRRKHKPNKSHLMDKLWSKWKLLAHDKVSIIDKQGESDTDVMVKISKARATFLQLNNIWNLQQMSNNIKVTIFNTNVETVLLYKAETSATNTTIIKEAHVFINSCLRDILNIHWLDTISDS
ncbi:unnamed protein product [Schistosoma margrebowiei]|uniref:DUF6451 domain-containing protein n=1 Tax=Schistosoma margrebowiei TaxID=48269 RepID=A0A3P8BCQ4_9TREM|nr:unnamed protein product [Schistosoma margrebowiei]